MMLYNFWAHFEKNKGQKNDERTRSLPKSAMNGLAHLRQIFSMIILLYVYRWLLRHCDPVMQ